MDLAITIQDVLDARARIEGRVHRTPVLTSRLLDDLFGRQLYFKCENLQRTGSFKIRGATNKLSSLDAAERARGVVTYSSGNHAQAVALAAQELSIEATIVMPSDAPRAKLDATRGYGAQVIEYDRQTGNRRDIALDIAEREGQVVVPPYDDPFIMAGQGTAGLELIEAIPDLDAVVTPIGGGGLLSGTATAMESAGSNIRAFGAEPAGADDVAQSLEAGHRVAIDAPNTIADGARTLSPGELTFPVLQEKVEAVVRVPDPALVRAMGMIMSRMKIVVEPTGALAAAAVFEGLVPDSLTRVGVILSGGNVDLAMLGDVLSSTGR